MSLFERLEALEEELQYYPYMNTINCIWYKDDNSIYWNTDNNLEDLENQGGNTYSGEINEGIIEIDECTLSNLDNGCGQTITYVFLKDKEVKFDE